VVTDYFAVDSVALQAGIRRQVWRLLVRDSDKIGRNFDPIVLQEPLYFKP